MVLTVDCGNTMIKFGLFEEDILKMTFSITTDRNKSSDEYGIILKTLASPDLFHVKGAIVSSVVPSLTDVLVMAIEKAYHITSLVVDKNLKTKMPIKIDNPSELGSDMLCGAIGATRMFSAPVVIADLGTATKLYVVDKNGCFAGCVITSGIRSTLKGLLNSTSLLLEVPIQFPKKVIGKNTKDSIQSGILNSQKYLIEDFAKNFEIELGYPLKRIITGGFSKVLHPKLEDFTLVSNLILHGLNEIYKVNSYEK